MNNGLMTVVGPFGVSFVVDVDAFQESRSWFVSPAFSRIGFSVEAKTSSVTLVCLFGEGAMVRWFWYVFGAMKNENEKTKTKDALPVFALDVPRHGVSPVDLEWKNSNMRWCAEAKTLSGVPQTPRRPHHKEPSTQKAFLMCLLSFWPWLL